MGQERSGFGAKKFKKSPLPPVCLPYVDQKDRALTGETMSIPPAELAKRRLRSVSWCSVYHALAVACLQAVFLFSPLHPYLWLISTLRSLFSFKFFFTLVLVVVLNTALVIFISNSLPKVTTKVHFSKIDFSSNQQPWLKKRAQKFSLFSILEVVKTFFSFLYELPMSALSGDSPLILLCNNVAALVVGFLFLDTSNKAGMKVFFCLMAGTFAYICNTSGRRFLEAAPVVCLPIRTQIRAVFKDTFRNLLLPCLKSFASINAFVSLSQLLLVLMSKDAEFMSIFSNLNFSFLLETFIIYTFLVMILTLTHKITLTVFSTNWHFPIESQNVETLGILDALVSSKDLKLAASRDLVFISELDAQRRAEFWVLSQPGGHPKRFNSLVKVFTTSVDKFKSDLTEQNVTAEKKGSAAMIFNPENTSTPNLIPESQQPSTPIQPLANRFKGLIYQTPQTPTIRNMESVQSPLRLQPVHQTAPQTPASPVPAPIESALKFVKDFFRPKEGTFGNEKINKKYLSLAASTVLSDAPFLSFLSSGIANMALASITEDKYGIVQLKLQDIVSGLLSLMATARSHEKLGVILANAKMSADEVADVNKALDLVHDTASRALCKIGKAFGRSLFDLRWSEKDKETLILFVD